MMLERSSPKEMNPTLSKLLIKPVLATAYGGIVGAFLGGTVGMVVMGLAGRNPQLLARSGSGAGLTFCFLSKGLKARPEQALFSAAGFAVMSATAYKMMQTTKPRNAQDAFYIETKAMLSKLGLEEYEKNFKKGHLTDFTLPLLTDSDLKDVNIPSGARRLILDHIKRFVHKLLYSHMDQMYELDPTMHSLLS
ncbi:hypothetical protein Bca52824_068623 [Brassica carinata]|uniref:SAM domain-containing protein n=1 Tax=Brassica carinata TaxID=52824 RepID=A0A8X7Q097_BRACI|nr:hypothetical protein Bca52824_068623 [Brassica carinata]